MDAGIPPGSWKGKHGRVNMKRDIFDRVIGSLDGIPGVRKTRPSTVTTVLPILGRSETCIVQTYRTEDGFVGFLQMVDAEGRARIVIPAQAMDAIARQRESLIRMGRKEAGKDRWKGMTEEEKRATVVRLRSGKVGSK